MAEGSEGDERPTAAMRPLEKPDSTRPTLAMPPLFKDADGGIADREVAGYVIDGEIGRGGMGIVYAATHAKTRFRAAVKVLGADPDGTEDAARTARFLREARAASEIGHPNIVDVITVGTLTNGRPYLVMELLEGETLRARLSRGALSILEACAVLHGCAAALAAAHARGLIHRDLKPDNVFLAGDLDKPPTPKLLDFGLVKLAARSDQDVLTRTGAIVGTPAYMSPEQVRAKPFDHRTDIYALGIMAYELITGALPFKKDNPLDTMIAHVNQPIPSVKVAVPSIPEALASIVERMMAKTPDARPTLAQVDHLLERILDIPSQPDLPRPNSEVPQQVDPHVDPRASATFRFSADSVMDPRASATFRFSAESLTDPHAIALPPDQSPLQTTPMALSAIAAALEESPAFQGVTEVLAKPTTPGPVARPPSQPEPPPQPPPQPQPQRVVRNIDPTSAVDPLPPPNRYVEPRTDLQPTLRQARRSSNSRLMIIVLVSLTAGALLAAIASYA